MKKVNILGTEYTIVVKEEEDEILERADGYIDKTTKEIVLLKATDKNCELKDKESYMKKVLRHEIMHGFLFESGLAESSGYAESWALNEEMIDWFAYQSPKIFKAFKDCDCL